MDTFSYSNKLFVDPEMAILAWWDSIAIASFTLICNACSAINFEIRAKFHCPTMSACSTRLYNTPNLTWQQRDDVLLEVVNQVGSIAKKFDVMWAHVFDKPKSSTNSKLEEEANKEGPKILHEGDFNGGDHS